MTILLAKLTVKQWVICLASQVVRDTKSVTSSKGWNCTRSWFSCLET